MVQLVGLLLAAGLIGWLVGVIWSVPRWDYVEGRWVKSGRLQGVGGRTGGRDG